MKCQHCGNELGPEEVFCGQCGNPNATPIQPTEMMQTPSTRSGLLNNGNRADAFPSSSSAMRQGSQQQGGFHQNATEAMSMAPGTRYPQSGFQNDSGVSGGYAGSGQFGTQQSFISGNYPSPTAYPPVSTGFSYGQGYGSQPGGMTPLPERRNNALIIVGIVCLIFAIITVGAFSTLFFLKNSSGQHPPVVQSTATIAPTPSPIPSPTPSPTPTIAATATPAPDANFTWCGTQCTQSGYQIEYPDTWTPGAAQNQPGVQFTNAGDVDTIYAAVKTPSSSATSADELLTDDASNFSSQTGYQSPQTLPSVTIGGTNWNAEVLYYQLNGHVEQVNIYATIYQGKGYIIELQAAQDQFSSTNSQDFAPMLNSFQFVTPTQ